MPSKFLMKRIRYKKKNISGLRTLVQHSLMYLEFNKRGSNGVNGAAVPINSELSPRFIISDLFTHVSYFVGVLYAARH